MGNTMSGDNDKQTDMYNKYIKQQQQQIQSQQRQINQLMTSRQPTQHKPLHKQSHKPSPPSHKQPYKQQQHTPHDHTTQSRQGNLNHPSNHNVKRVPKSAKTQMNPYKILGIDKNYTETSLKKAYIRMAVKTHPDKGGSDDLFQQVTIAYTLLLKKLSEKDSDRQHSELKTGYDNFRETSNSQPRQNVKFGSSMNDNERFDVNLFNKVYDDNKFSTEDDNGYGKWIKKTALGEEAEDNPKLFNGKFNKDVFNNVFHEIKQKNSMNNRKQLIEYEEPLALNSGGHQLQILGKGTIKDFSSQEVLTSGIQYRDYKDAYTNSTLIDVNSVDIGDRAGDIKSYQRQRSNISHKMSAEDEIQYQKIQQYKANLEKNRVNKLKKDDTRITDHYERVHKLLIRN